MMSENSPSENVSFDDRSALEELAWAIENSGGEFSIILAHCNYIGWRQQLAQQLQQLCPVQIRTLELKKSEKTLYARIQAELGQEKPAALMVFGLEMVEDLEQLLISANQLREEFQKNFHFPLVLWVNDEILKVMNRVAVDFESWSTTTEFGINGEELTNFIQQKADRWFADRLILTRAENFELQVELSAAARDLRNYPELNGEISANLESLFGAVKFNDRQIDEAYAHYQKALAIWRELHNFERQGKLLSEMTLCCYQKALHHSDINHPEWQTTQDYLRQAIAAFESANRPDLVANSLLNFGVILRRLQDWEQLENLAQKSRSQHPEGSNSLELARDYGFLAEVALARKDWPQAKELAGQALTILDRFKSNSETENISDLDEKLKASAISYAGSQYQFILGQAHYNLNQIAQAIENLEAAKEVGVPDYDTQLYIEILGYLQKVYSETKKYLKAFQIKLERQSIEQQYGLRAFIGAGRIQPQRQAKLTLTQVENRENVALEIQASGRYLDVEKLIERVGNTDSKLIVIHGQSGVGKSSLVNGGLIPRLKQISIGNQVQRVLPVAMRVYTNWVAELGHLLAEALLEKGIVDEQILSLTSPPTPLLRGEGSNISLTSPPTPLLQGEGSQEGNIIPPFPRREGGLGGLGLILEQLNQSESRNLRSVLIFDQFEEFFFVDSKPAERQEFFQFIADCLNLLPVKVILSLREDYLHYLLAGELLPSMKIIGNDILAKNVRYPIGNFSCDAAKEIIQDLTQRANFRLEEALIEELVRDLARELGQVRPIELQVVGAQLQTDKITTLAEYQQLGESAKEELVKRYLAEVVNDCGEENKQAAELVLYLLTDEKGTRPLKTRAELERDLQALAGVELRLEATGLDLVLEVFVGSGLVLLLPEKPNDRYQLVHDYLANFIRQQQEPKLKMLMAELEKERKQRKVTEEKLNRFLKRALMGSIAAGFGFAALAVAALGSWRAEEQRKRAEISQIEAISNSSETLLVSRQTFNALIESLKAAEKLKQAAWATDETKAKVLAVLEPAVYGVKERNGWEAHTSSVNSVSFSPDGQTIASASDDNTVKLWNRQGQLLKTLSGHTSSVYSVSFSPDGQTIASASADKTVKLWNRQGQLLKTLSGHTDYVNSVSFSPDGQTIASASDDKTVKLWNRQGQLLKTFSGHSSYVNSVSFSPDGQTIASASDDKTVKLWNRQGQLLKTFSGHSSYVNSVSFSPDGQTIASASADKTVKLWNRQGQLLKTFSGHSITVRSVSFSPDGQTIASASDDKTVKLWNRQGQLLKTFSGHSITVRSVSFSPDGETIASASDDKTVKLWNRKDKEFPSITGHSSIVYSVSFSPDGKTIASASADKTVKLWNRQGQLLKTFSGHSSYVNSVSFSPDGQTIASASDDKTVKLWNRQGQLLKTFSGHSSYVNSVSFSPDGQTIASASDDKTVKLWNRQGQLLKTFSGHSSYVRSVSFSPDGQTIASASYDKTVKLWNRQGQLLKTLSGHTDYVNSVSFSPDGQTIASASADKTVKLWNRQGQLLRTFSGHTDTVYSVSFSPDGQTIASGSYDKTVKLWNRQGQLLKTFPGHTNSVFSVSFSPDGQTIASGSGDNSVILWKRDVDINTLVKYGCNWLNDYLITHPETLEELQECHSQSLLKQASPVLVKEAEELARKGDINAATDKFSQAKQWNPSLNFNPKAKAKDIADKANAQRLLNEGEQLVKEGNAEGAIAKFQAALELDSNLNFNPQAKVQGIITKEKANKLISKGEEQANLGDIKGAIAYFQQALKVDSSLKFIPTSKAQQLTKAEAKRLVSEGKDMAKSGNIKDATSNFQKALKLDPSLKFNPQIELRKNQAIGLVINGENLAKEGKIKEAIAAYAQAQKLDPKVKISVPPLYYLCWQGSLRGSAADVMPACEKAVSIALKEEKRWKIWVHNSRGIARALTGNKRGAIDDFQVFIAETDAPELKLESQRWVNDLKAGKNPFTAEERKRLLDD